MAHRFLTFEIDKDRRELRDGGELVSLSPKSFDVLCYLIAHRDRMVTKAELLDQFWSRQVSEAALQKAISLLRKATHCDGSSVISTYHGLGFRFVPELSEPSPDGPSNTEGTLTLLRERSLVSVLSLRIGTSASHDDAAIKPFLDQARASVQTHRGHALRMTIHGFSASFGLEYRTENAARNAVHCAKEIIGEASKFKELQVTIGIDHGPVDLSDGTEDMDWRRPTDIERRASLLADADAPNSIILSGKTRDHLRDDVSTTPLDDGFRLVSVRDRQAGVPSRPLTQAARFVGRAAEMAFLETSLSTLADGNGHGVVLSGAAGIGKTRLISEFLDTLDHQTYQTIKLQCLPGLSNSPLAPIREMCVKLFEHPPRDTVRTDVDRMLHAELVGKTPAPARTPLSEHQRKQQSYELVSRMLAAACTDRPLILVFEDIHWLDVTSRDCLDAVIRRADDMPLLVVMTTRPTDDPPPCETIVHLSPLGHHDGLKLLYDTVSQTQINNEQADHLVRRAAGNPFFIEELAFSLQNGADPARNLPQTVQAVISVRIGALDDAERTFLFVLAVAGSAARIGLVTHLLGQPAELVHATAARLRQKGFIRTEADTFRFRHMLINDTAYAMLAQTERRKMHTQVAAYLESDLPDWTPRMETLAWHHQEAGQADRASACWSKACRIAMQRLAYREAIVFARNGLNLMAAEQIDVAKRELDLQLYLAYALAAMKGYGDPDVGAAYNAAGRINKSVKDQPAAVRVIVGLWIHTWVAGDLSKSLSHARDLLNLTKRTKNPDLHLQAHASVGQVLVHTGRLNEALSHLTEGLGAIADNPPESQRTQSASTACAAYACWAQGLKGNTSEVQRLLEVSHNLSHSQENPMAQAIHFSLCANPFMFLGQVAPCLENADRAIAISRTHDFPFWLGTGLMMRGWAFGQMGQLDAAFDALDEGVSVFEATGAGVQLANWYGLKAETLLVAGRLDEGIASATHALNCAGRTGDIYFTPRIHAVASRLWHELNAPDKAAEHAQKAVQRAAEFGMAKALITLPK